MHFAETAALALAFAVVALATSPVRGGEAGKEDQGKKAASSQPDPYGQPPGKWATYTMY